MTGAMYAAISGLKTHMSALNVIGNNISNVNTVAYKATRYTFSEALYTTVHSGSDGTDSMGGINPAQIGYGCSVGTIDLDMSTKNFNPTASATDCMIDGDGFFMVGDKDNLGVTTQTALQTMKLTRLGNFTFDSQGYLVDGAGNVVFGFLRMGSIDDVGQDGFETEADLTSKILTPIRVPNCEIYQTEITGEDGTVTPVSVTNVLWPTENEEIGVVQDSEVAQNNGQVSRLKPDTVTLDKTGRITVMTSDEQMVVLGYIALGKVDNPNGVTHVDGRYYQALDGAGTLHLSTVGGSVVYVPEADADTGSQLTIESAGDTKLVPGGLESSGTDLATEISNMIMIQRGYQANTRIVTVTDSMLEELVNMKR